MALEFSSIIGLIGAIGYVIPYAILQIRREFAKTISYSLVNFISGGMVVYSLTYDYNLAAMISNVFWMGLSLFGIYRCLKYKELHWY